MKNRPLNIFGTGGHAKVVFETAKLSDQLIDGFYDDNKKMHKKIYCGVEVKGPINSLTNADAIIAIGDNKVRQNICNGSKDINWITLIHLSAIIAANVEIGDGSLIVAGAIIQPGTKIGNHCIVNTNASIDHDCEINDFVHISPSATLCGNILVGEGTLIGAGATIIPNIKIGKWCIIGAGAVINKEIPDYSLVVGVPGRIIKHLNYD